MDCNALQRQISMWLVDVLDPMGCQTIDQLTKEKCKAPLKDKIAGNLYSVRGSFVYQKTK